VSRHEIDVEQLARNVVAPSRRTGPAGRVSLRPSTLAEFVGQRELVRHLEIVLGSRGRAIRPRITSCSPVPRVWQDPLASIVAAEMGGGLRITSGRFSRDGRLGGAAHDLQDGDVLFVDEIHRLSRGVEEILYPAMEDRRSTS